MSTNDISSVISQDKLDTLGRRNNALINSKKKDDSPSIWFSKRMLVSLVLFLGLMNYQILRCNINIAVVEMTSRKLHIVNGNISVYKADFDWDPTTVALVSSIVSYGGMFAIFGGFVANILGNGVTCAICTILSGILTLAQPATLCLDFYYFLGLRLLTGLFEEFFYVSTLEVHSLWFPKKERLFLMSTSYNGCNAGLAVVYPLCGYLAHGWGWEMVFYITGTISILIAVLLWIFVKNKPSEDRWISKKELEYILADTDQTSMHKVSYPFKRIFTSAPFCSLFGILCAMSWVTTIIQLCLPLYVEDYTHKGTNIVGLISALPNLVYFFTFPLNGVLLDYWKNHSGLSFTQIHKIILTIAFLGAGGFFLVAALLSDFTLSLVMFVLTQIITSPSLIILGFIATNLAPEHCNIVAGLSSVFLCLFALLPQALTGVLLSCYGSQGWNICFFSTALASVIGAVWFMRFGSSETQRWSVVLEVKT